MTQYKQISDKQIPAAGGMTLKELRTESGTACRDSHAKKCVGKYIYPDGEPGQTDPLDMGIFR